MSVLPTVDSLSLLLPFTLLAPLVAMLLIVFLPKEEAKTIKLVAALGMFVSLVLSLYAFFTYQWAAGGMQFTLTIPWVPDLGV
ncbi:MAG TPA: NADH-quinone oxidoreductase subunit M, partial [Desulfosporosinus sp.]|nr:NADH-quinone oxidoreductase subunit M [Desulfosporosinus sp.]